MRTDVVRKVHKLIPALPVPPFSIWRRWLSEHFDAVHCALEWRTENGKWFYAELRSTRSQDTQDKRRVGWGQIPGTGYDAYGVYIGSGRLPRTAEVTLDEVISCDYRQLEEQICCYAARDHCRAPGRAGDCKANRGLGGPAFKPSQNSNTMVNFVLKACGVTRKAPDKAIGWDTVPRFPYSTDKDTFSYDTP